MTKVWDDNGNQENRRPANLTVTLSNGTEVTLNEQNNWSQTVTNLPKYENDELIVYTWTEGEMPEGYRLSNTSVNGTVTTLTNSYTPVETEATVEKIWVENGDHTHPNALKVWLRANETRIQEVMLNNGQGWSHTITGLPKYANGDEIIYTWEEESVSGYEMTSSKNGTITRITNTYNPKIDIPVTKIWSDGDNQDGKRTESVSVQLRANGDAVGDPVVLNDGNSWSYTWEDQPVYLNGTEIKYSVVETTGPADYTVDYGGNKTDGFVVTNSYTPEKTSATVKKVWDDANNQDGKRPASLTVTLSNGTEVTLNGQNNWEATVNDLPKYKDQGTEIVYSWTEGEMPEGYSLKSSEKVGTVTTLTNSHTPEETEATVKKVWDDANNQAQSRH